jgi:four helix bundle protein
MQNKEKDLRDRTKAFAFQIIQMFAGLPKTTQAQVLGKQVLRSGTSVGANYREAYRGRSKAEFIAKCGDSLRELEETAYWLEASRRWKDRRGRKALSSSTRMRRTHRDIRYDPETNEAKFLILPSYL